MVDENPFILKANDIKISQQLVGEGSFGDVRVAKWLNAKVAAKLIHTESQSSCEEINVSLREELLKFLPLRHPNIVLLLGIREGYIQEGYTQMKDNIINPVIINELMPYCLHDLLEGLLLKPPEKADMKLPEVIDIVLDIANALVYLHGHNPPIIHGNITAKNIMIDTGRHAKLADLGHIIFHPVEWSKSISENGVNIKVASNSAYAAPEILRRGQVSEKIDIHSLGVVLIYICSGEIPSSELRERHVKMSCEKFPMLKQVIEGATAKHPSDRWTAQVMCEHLELLRANDRYYPSNNFIVPDKDIGYLTRRWMQLQIDSQQENMRISLKQTSSSLQAVSDKRAVP